MTEDQWTIESHTTEANGQRIHYLIAGGGPPLVLLHGWPQHSHHWRSIMPALAERFTVLAPDLRGVGGSTKPRGSYAKRYLAEDLRSLLDQLFGKQPVNLCGYDWGADTAFVYSATWPDAVRRLALLEMVFPGFGYEEVMTPKPGWDGVWHLAAFTAPDVCERFFMGRERDLLAWYFWRGSDNPNAISMDDFELYVRTLQLPNALRAGMEFFAAVWEDAEHNRQLAKQKLTVPVLAMGGRQAIGEAVGGAATQFAEDVQSVVIDGAGHWLTDEAPDIVTDSLLHFFK